MLLARPLPAVMLLLPVVLLLLPLLQYQKAVLMLVMVR
jgi:hypothetical protein